MKRQALRRVFRGAGVIAASATLVVATSTTALAEDLPPGSGTQITSSTSSSSSHTEAHTVAVNGIDINSDVTVLAYIMAHGLPASMRHHCYHLKQGQYLWTNYRTVDGTIKWKRKWFAAGHLLCVNIEHGHRVVRDSVCGNIVKHTPPPVRLQVRGKVKIVSSFRFKASAKADATGTADSTAFAWINTDTCKASASGSGHGFFHATAVAVAYGRTRVRAEAQASGNAVHQLVLQNNTALELKERARAMAEGEASSDASAHVECSGVPANQPPTIFVVWPPHVLVGGSQAIFMEASDPDGTVGTPVATNDSHARITSIIPVDVRWDGTPCPVDKTCFRGTLWGDVVGTAHLTVTVTDDDGATATTSGDVQVVDRPF